MIQKKAGTWRLATLVAASLSISAALTSADTLLPGWTYSVLKSFESPVRGFHNPLLLGRDGALYGTTVDGGSHGSGTVFRVSPDGTGFTTLFSFNITNGWRPRAGLIQAPDGTLFGTTSLGGAFGNGTVFRLQPDGSEFATLVDFNGTNGGYPEGALALGADGSLYGTTTGGGEAGGGTLFRVLADGSGFATLLNFSAASGRASRAGLVAGPDGALYGETAAAGPGGSGTVFKVNTDGTGFATLTSFNVTNGANPVGLILGRDGLLYGTTSAGGPGGLGTLFRVALDGSGFLTLVAFDGAASGRYPQGAPWQAADGTLYGTTSQGGSVGQGTLFRVGADGSGFATAVSFTTASGVQPQAGVIQGADGALYGTTTGGGPAGRGTVFKVSPDGSALATLVSPAEPAAGAGPWAEVTQGPDGALYGTLSIGGPFGTGAVFKVNPDGAGFSTLATFDVAHGASPQAGLLIGPDGLLYGTTISGGAGGSGTVFRLDSDGRALTTLVDFNSANGAIPWARLIRGNDGALYGTTYTGGASGTGTAFKVNPDGSGFTTLANFNSTSGGLLRGALVQYPDGVLYGTTVIGGSSFRGTVFAILPDGRFGTFRSLGASPQEPAAPNAGLLIGKDGALYGVTTGGGQNGLGAVFKLGRDGSLATLASFATPGAGTSSLIQGSDGALYGTTFGSVSNSPLPGGSYGTVFRVNPDGSGFTTLVSFTGPDGANPAASLYQGPDGTFYGTTYNGGPLGGGVVFRLDPPRTTPTITWNPSPLVVGTPLAAAQLNATASVPGTFTYSPGQGTILPGGPQTLNVQFAPADTFRYRTVSATASVIVERIKPVLTWPTPADIVEGTAINGTQLNATASVPGTFFYEPPAGVIMSVGAQRLSVTFKPQDPTYYATVTGSVWIAVRPETPPSGQFVAFGNGAVYAAATGAIVGNPFGQRNWDVAITTDGTRLYLAGGALRDTVDVYRTADRSLVASMAIPLPVAVTVLPDDSKGYVCSGTGGLYVFDPRTNSITGTAPVTGFLAAAALSPDGRRLYVVDEAFGLHILDTLTDTLLASIDLRSAPFYAFQAVAISPDGRRAYVADMLSSQLTVVDTVTKSAITRVGVAYGSVSVAVAPDGYVYVDNASGRINVIDPRLLSVVRSLDAGDTYQYGPVRGLTIDPLGLGIFVAGDGGPDRRIDIATGAVTFLASGNSRSVTKTLVRRPTPLAIERVSPEEIGDSGQATVSVYGSGFLEGATVTLRAAAQEVSSANAAVAKAGAQLTARFELSSFPIGPATLEVRNPNGGFASMVIEVAARKPSQIWVDVVAPVYAARSRATALYVTVGNAGNTDALAVPLVLSVPANVELEPAFNLQSSAAPDATGTDTSSIPISYLSSSGDRRMPLLIARLAAGGVPVVLKFNIRATVVGPLHGAAWAGPPMIDEGVLTDSGFAALGAAALAVPGEHLPLAIPEPSSEAARCISAVASTLADFWANSMKCGAAPKAVLTIAAEIKAWADLLQNGDADSALQFVVMRFSQIADIAKCVVPDKRIEKIIQAVQFAFDSYQVYKECGGDRATRQAIRWSQQLIQWTIDVLTSWDPNDKLGPAGSGDGHYVSRVPGLQYAIQFENKPEATAPAQEVVVSDQLNPADVDLRTFSFGPVSFGSRVLTPPAGVSRFELDDDLRPSESFVLRVTGELDATNGKVTWRFRAIDPATGLLPEDPLTGFLPADVNPPEGQGSVVFSVRARADRVGTAPITNSAEIVFDTNPAIITPVWSNTIDGSAPESRVAPLPARQTASDFTVSWSGTDQGSGVGDYSVFVSQDGQPFTTWLDRTPSTSATFLGAVGHTYAFFAVARDKVGNEESLKDIAEATTEIVSDVTPPLVVPHVSGTQGSGGWFVSAVTVAWDVTDPESGVLSSSGCEPTTLTADTAGTTATCSVTNGAGLSSSMSVEVKIDQTPPVVSVSAPSNGTSYVLGQELAAAFSCADAGSGVAGCVGSVPVGAVVDTGSVGGRTFTVTAADMAGNAASIAVTYEVIFAPAGRCLVGPGHTILFPIDPAGSSVFPVGLPVPARFRVCDASGKSISTPGVVTAFKLVRTVAGGIASDVNQDVPTMTPPPAFRWDPLLQDWFFLIDTRKYRRKTGYEYRISLVDGSSIDFGFRLQ